MVEVLYEKLNISPVATIIISVAMMLFVGYLLTRITKLLKLPNVTAYILAGILLGPYCLNAIPAKVISGMDFLSDIALAFIAFGTGEFFRFSELKKNGGKVIVITVFESLAASAAIFVVMYFILRLDLAFSAVIAALAAATAPASTLMTIRQTGAKGDFVNTLLQVVALDDIVGLVAYSIAISVAVAAKGEGVDIGGICLTLAENIGIMALGGFFGVLMRLLMPKKRSTDNRLIISIATLFAFCGICAIIGISPLLGCMAMGTVYMNITEDDKLFKQLNYFNPPILLLFFVHSGLSFKLGDLFENDSAIGAYPLLAVGAVFFITRIVGKYAGSFVGCSLVKKDKKVRNFLGLALIPQAGVAIGLAALGARTLGGSLGSALQTVILASSVLYELIGPASAKLSLWLSGAYSNNIDELVPIEEKLSPVDELVAKINKIREETPRDDAPSPEEAAFDEAAEEQYAILENIQKRQRNRRKFL